jgi:hypothetical protein
VVATTGCSVAALAAGAVAAEVDGLWKGFTGVEAGVLDAGAVAVAGRGAVACVSGGFSALGVPPSVAALGGVSTGVSV